MFDVIYIIISFILFLFLYKLIGIIYEKYDTFNYKQQEKQQTQKKQSKKEQEIYSSKQNEFPDCLKILGFTKYPSNNDEIKVRYKKLIKIYHPDNGGTEEEFQRISKAYNEAMLLSIYKKIN